MADEKRGGDRTVDWSKPIQFENGKGCDLIRTEEEGAETIPGHPRVIRRHGETEDHLAIWHMPENGWSPHPGYSIINTPAAP